MVAVRITVMLARLAGVAGLVLGLLFWSGRALALVSVHMALGAILVLSLWTLAGIGLRRGINSSTIAIAVAWGLIVPVLGVVQLAIPSGGGYGVVRVLHLLVGLGAIVQAESLAKQIGLREPSRSGEPRRSPERDTPHSEDGY